MVVLSLLGPADLAMLSRAGPELRAPVAASGLPRAGCSGLRLDLVDFGVRRAAGLGQGARVPVG